MNSAPASPTSEDGESPIDFQKAMEAAFQRYLRGVKIIAESFDVPVGLTPRQAIWNLNKATLYRYEPIKPAAERHPTPLLLVYALVNKAYVFDLRPGQSFVEYLLGQGFDLYLLDWGSPGLEDRHTSLDDYVTQYLPRAIRKMLRHSQSEEYSMLGYCLGATLCVLHASLFPESPLRNLILLAGPIDFSKKGDSLFASWFDERYFDVDRLVNALGNIPVELIETGAKMLKPVENYVGAYATVWERLEDPDAIQNWQAFHKWIHDGVPFAGEAFRQWVKDFVRANKLVRGEMVVGGRLADLKNIHAALLNVVAQYDHIVPPSQSVGVNDLVSSADRQLELIPAGHVGIMSGRGGRYKLWPKIATWLGERSG